ncbi:MAG: hypothetical protein L6428_12910 [Candidatus Aminicenantes bacterium]|nr:hypothetical protein [Acidobacteriota bacterium]MCG2812332.1 hypothetical protein [Candidatus Aminicenantes bacterium]
MVKKKEKEAKLKLLHRLLISYLDFQQAWWIASYIIKHKFQEKTEKLQGKRRYHIKLLWEALNCAMIISYCRPFSGNDRNSTNRIPNLPERFLKILTNKEKELHSILMKERNTILAHSDSDAWELQTYFLEVNKNQKMLIPSHTYTRSPLTHKIVEQIRTMINKLMESVFKERMKIEKELENDLPSVSISELIRIKNDI